MQGVNCRLKMQFYLTVLIELIHFRSRIDCRIRVLDTEAARLEEVARGGELGDGPEPEACLVRGQGARRARRCNLETHGERASDQYTQKCKRKHASIRWCNEPCRTTIVQQNIHSRSVNATV